jgi:HAD superfamily hydrolase (TIGR01509 family)
MKFYGALFDLDGVLIDSESTYTRFWQEIDRIYPTGIENYAIAIKGTTLPEIMKHYDDESVKSDILRRIHDFQESMTYELYPGVVGFLTELRDRGIRSAIVTSSDNRKMQLLFEQLPQLKELVDVVVDASMVTRSKPDPEGYLKAAEAIGCNPDDCFVFEDSIQGLKAGNASGATVIALATTYPQEQLKGKAAKIIGGFEDFNVDDMLAVSRL